MTKGLLKKGMISGKFEVQNKINIDDIDPALAEEISDLAQDIFGNNMEKKAELGHRLLSNYIKAQGYDTLLIHSPGGWGSSGIDDLIDWERSVVDGVRKTIEQMGCQVAFIQYYRSHSSWWGQMQHLPEQARYLFTGKLFLAEVMAAEIKFLAEHMKNLNIILLGVSQGAAFNNTVMKYVGKDINVYSIELGIFFAQLPRRIITEKTLALDSNGLMPDPVVHRNLKAALKAYFFAPFSWVKYKLAGRPMKFTYCINVPGHDYNWKYPEVNGQIVSFLQRNIKKR